VCSSSCCCCQRHNHQSRRSLGRGQATSTPVAPRTLAFPG
jgi:hypothetical protein